MAFEGMDTDAGRQVSDALRSAGDRIKDIFEGMRGSVDGVDWLGPDRDAFVSDWQSFISQHVDAVQQAFTETATALTQHADQQDQASGASA